MVMVSYASQKLVTDERSNEETHDYCTYCSASIKWHDILSQEVLS